MEKQQSFQKRMERLAHRAQQFSQAWDTVMTNTENEFNFLMTHLDEAKRQKMEELHFEEERIKGELDQSAQQFTKAKYLLEKESLHDQSDINRAEDDLSTLEKQTANELRRLHEDQVATQISHDKQKSALTELYHEKKRSLMVAKEKLSGGLAKSTEALSQFKQKISQELEQVQADYSARIQVLKDQLHAKQQGWNLALETVQRERSIMVERKKDIDDKIGAIRADKEKELESAKISLIVAREQLELDKVSLIEKAEQEQRDFETQVRELTQAVEKNELDLQNLVDHKQKELHQAEEAFLKEEAMLKEAVKLESEKRDYEQKLFVQEKTQKEEELKRLQEDYDKKKSHWENQIRTLTIQKSVQDAEHESERLRTDREARTIVRSLEAKREELRQRLSDIKTRYESLEAHSKKEQDLLQQRWSWRKDRLWNMWQSRLEVLKKEREAIHLQLEQLDSISRQKRDGLMGDEGRDEKRISDLREFNLQSHERADADQKQRKIQFELEKTRIIAQIKECETLLSDWVDRQKMMQQDMGKRAQEFSAQLGFIDQLCRSEQSEAELFMHAFQRALGTLGTILEKNGAKHEAA